MVFSLELILLALAALLAIPVLVLLFQVAMATRERRALAAHADIFTPRPRIAILMPAHDEEAGIAEVLSSLRRQLQKGDRLLVVADNCADKTAEVARACGAEVCERRDPERRGKGYALDFGMRYLAADPVDVVVVVDADCFADEGAIAALAREACRTGRPVQALYMMYSQTRERLTSRIAEFAWVVKNHVRPLGLHRAGWPCQLMGTGMAFPWRIISRASIANGHLVEDMKLGLDLALAGTPPRFAPEARVFSHFPVSDRGTKAQRTRWEHGHLSIIRHDVPRLLMSAIAEGNAPLAMLALDLLVPPLALLTLMTGAAFLLSVVLYLLAGSALPALMSAAVVAALCASIILSWRRFGRDVIRPSDLLLAIAYAAWKIPLYIRFFVKRQVEWVRSERNVK